MLRNDSFMLMRKAPVDLSRYLPYFLYNDEVFANIQSALNRQHENYRLKLIEMEKQFFIQTANSNGLSDWEQFLKIPQNEDSDEELRRKVVAMKMLRNTVMTVENTKKLMTEFAPYGNVDVEELGNNRLKLIINNGTFFWDELMTALWEWLPAHLIFSFDINEDFGTENVHFAQANADASFELVDLDLLSPPVQNVSTSTFEVENGVDYFDFDCSDQNSHLQTLHAAIFEMDSEFAVFDCDRDEILDEESIIQFERFIRERWLTFKQNAVVKYYRHSFDDFDGEIDNPDDDEIFPVESTFLRIYWKFPCANGDWHLRYQTIFDVKDNLSPADIEYLSFVGASTGMLLHSKLNIPTNGILRALYIKKEEIKIL